MITSTHNPKVQFVRGLLSHAKDRREANAFVVEGVRLTEEAFAAGWQMRSVFYSEDLGERGMALVEKIRSAGIEVEAVSAQVTASISDTETPQGIQAVVSVQELPMPAQADFLVIADNIRDPGNLGTILRTAKAAGAQGVLLSPASVDAFSPKVLRAGMGAHFRMPIRKLEWDQMRALLKEDRPQDPVRVYSAEMNQGESLWQADLRRPVAILVGSEAEGPSPEGLALSDAFLHIPMPGASESLNAAVAAAVIMFEVVRQRQVVNE